MKIEIFSSSQLPAGFSYPHAFIYAITSTQSLDLGDWFFISAINKNRLTWLDILKKQYPSRLLIPFAKRSSSDDVACFDGSDTSGNPKVLYIHAFAAQGWENRGEERDFSAWLSAVLEEAKSE